MDEKSLINQPISLLGLSSDFERISKVMKLETISQILKIDPMDLVVMEGFNYNWLNELVRFLSKHQLLYLLQPQPGNNPG